MFKRFAKCTDGYKKETIITPIFVAFEVILEVLIPLYMADLIDFGIDAGNMNVIIKMGIVLTVFAFFALLFGVLAGKTAALASAGFARNLRRQMFCNVQSFSFANIDKFSTGSIVTRLTTDVTNVQMAFQVIIRMAIRAPLMLVFSLIAAIKINARLSLVFLAIVPILGVGLFAIIKAAFPIFDEVFKAYDKLNNVVSENLRGIRVVKSFVREDFETEKFKGVSLTIYKLFSKAEKLIALNMPLLQFCMYVCMLLISWFGARAVVASGGDALVGLSTGGLMSLLTYTMQILISLMVLSMVFVMITIAKASAERTAELLDEKSTITNPENPVFAVADGSIDFIDIDFSYSKNAGKNVLQGINLHIASGETVGILGGTGSSKTSLVQLIPRLYDVTAGMVKVGGVDVRDYDIDTLRGEIGVVLQKNVLFSGTIKENLRWGCENATDEEMIEACKLAQADGFISESPNGYDTHIEQGGTNVSGGQKQRISIARALLKKPKILIFDDSTSAVDTKTDAQIRKALTEHLPNTTKLIIAQRVASVADADKIIVMDDGKIEAMGNHNELLETCEIYREIYFSQQKGGELDG